jgi:hypothetical protein
MRMISIVVKCIPVKYYKYTRHQNVSVWSICWKRRTDLRRLQTYTSSRHYGGGGGVPNVPALSCLPFNTANLDSVSHIIRKSPHLDGWV